MYSLDIKVKTGEHTWIALLFHVLNITPHNFRVQLKVLSKPLKKKSKREGIIREFSCQSLAFNNFN